jgi:hypothetical protein
MGTGIERAIDAVGTGIGRVVAGGGYWPSPPQHLKPPMQLCSGQWTLQQLWGPLAGGLSMPRGTSPMPCGPPAAGGSG